MACTLIHKKSSSKLKVAPLRQPLWRDSSLWWAKPNRSCKPLPGGPEIDEAFAPAWCRRHPWRGPHARQFGFGDRGTTGHPQADDFNRIAHFHMSIAGEVKILENIAQRLYIISVVAGRQQGMDLPAIAYFRVAFGGDRIGGSLCQQILNERFLQPGWFRLR